MKEALRIDLSNDAKPLLSSGPRKAAKGSTKTGGELRGAIDAVADKDGARVKIRDANSGVLAVVRRYLINGTLPAYSVIMRIPESFGESARGLLIEGCIDNVDIGAARRRKRSVTSAAGQYDAKETKDPKAEAMAASATSEISSIASEDKNFTSILPAAAPPISTNMFLLLFASPLLAWLM